MAQVSRQEVEQACEDMHTAIVPCGGFGTAEQWINDCIDALDSVRRDYLGELVECWQQTACENIEYCASSVANGLEPLDIADEYAEACRAKQAECGASAYEIVDRCDIDDIKKFGREVVLEMTSCFEEACEAIPSCLDAALD